jgi:hypothetical protein
LRANPFQYPTKEGALANTRGVDLHFRGQKYRLGYQIYRQYHMVLLIVLDERKSGRVYRRAKKLLASPPGKILDIDP